MWLWTKIWLDPHDWWTKPWIALACRAGRKLKPVILSHHMLYGLDLGAFSIQGTRHMEKPQDEGEGKWRNNNNPMANRHRPWKWAILVETNLPTPMTARVYVNLLEGISHSLANCWSAFSLRKTSSRDTQIQKTYQNMLQICRWSGSCPRGFPCFFVCLLEGRWNIYSWNR